MASMALTNGQHPEPPWACTDAVLFSLLPESPQSYPDLCGSRSTHSVCSYPCEKQDSGSSNQPIYGMHFLSELRIDPNVHCVDV